MVHHFTADKSWESVSYKVDTKQFSQVASSKKIKRHGNSKSCVEPFNKINTLLLSSWLNVRCAFLRNQLKFSAEAKPAIQYVDRHNVICQNFTNAQMLQNLRWWSNHSKVWTEVKDGIYSRRAGRETKRTSQSQSSKDVWDDDQTQVLNKTAKCFKIRLKIYKEPVANDNTKITN